MELDAGDCVFVSQVTPRVVSEFHDPQLSSFVGTATVHHLAFDLSVAISFAFVSLSSN